MIHETENEPEGSLRPRFLWWRFGIVAIALFFIALGFSMGWYCEPLPSTAQQVLFFFVLALTFIQTVQAGWYRNDTPWEIGLAEMVVAIAGGVIIALLILAFILFVITSDPSLSVVLPIAIFLFIAFVFWMQKTGGPRD